MSSKVYAVKVGFDKFKGEKIENQLYDNWIDCEKVVKGVKGAKYKSFTNKEEANKYLFGSNKMSFKAEGKYPKGCNHSYVDGSFDAKLDRYSYGVVVVFDNIIMKIMSGSGPNKTGQRQIIGELTGAKKALYFAHERGDKQIVIFHDYNGVGAHATGEWSRNSSIAEAYHKCMQKFSQGKEVEYVKVDAHTGDIFNELVDDVAKYELGISSTRAVSSALGRGERLIAGNEEVYKKLIEMYDHRFIDKAY